MSDLYPKNEKPIINKDTSISDSIIEISSKRLGCAVVTEDDKVLGIITDGDLRRMLNNKEVIDTRTQKAESIMTKSPKCINADAYAVEAFNIMQQFHITQLVVVDDKERYLGIVHIHDLISEGII